MDRIQLVSVLVAAILLLGVLELVRRRRLLERYAIGWLTAAFITLAFALWSNGLSWLAGKLGIIYAPNALFFMALGFIVLLLLHFSAAVSRLTDQSKILAQRLALLESRLGELEPREEGDEEPVAALAQNGSSPATSRSRGASASRSE
ncbi:MAG TPA: DUF2304 domain-containing protein [Baekduia sp.]|nr:DUF2304 domain-containing protein [Baekduia sp.]